MFFDEPINNLKTSLFCENRYKIAKNHSILIKLTVLNSQDFAIFETPRFFDFGQFLMAEGRDWGLFCTLLFQLKVLKRI